MEFKIRPNWPFVWTILAVSIGLFIFHFTIIIGAGLFLSLFLLAIETSLLALTARRAFGNTLSVAPTEVRITSTQAEVRLSYSNISSVQVAEGKLVIGYEQPGTKLFGIPIRKKMSGTIHLRLDQPLQACGAIRLRLIDVSGDPSP